MFNLLEREPGDIVEILQVGDRFYVPPEDEARVMVPRLLKIKTDGIQLTTEEIDEQIRRIFGSNPEEDGSVTHDDSATEMAERDEGTSRPGGGGPASPALGSEAIDRTAPGGHGFRFGRN